MKIREEGEEEGNVDEEVESLFKHMDTDCSGTVSYSEFFRAERINELPDPTSKAAFNRLSSFFGKDHGEQEEIIKQNNVKLQNFHQQKNGHGRKEEDEEYEEEELKWEGIVIELKREIKAVQDQIKKNQIEKETSANEIHKLGIQLENLATKFEKTEASGEDLKIQLIKLKEESDRTKDGVSQELQRLEFSELLQKQRNEELKIELSDIKKKIGQLEEKHQHVQQEVSASNERIDQLADSKPDNGKEVQRISNGWKLLWFFYPWYAGAAIGLLFKNSLR